MSALGCVSEEQKRKPVLRDTESGVVLGAPPLLLIDLSAADTCSLPAARAGVTGRHSATVTGSGTMMMIAAAAAAAAAARRRRPPRRRP